MRIRNAAIPCGNQDYAGSGAWRGVCRNWGFGGVRDESGGVLRGGCLRIGVGGLCTDKPLSSRLPAPDRAARRQFRPDHVGVGASAPGFRPLRAGQFRRLGNLYRRPWRRHDGRQSRPDELWDSEIRDARHLDYALRQLNWRQCRNNELQQLTPASAASRRCLLEPRNRG